MDNGELLESDIQENCDLLLYDGITPGKGKTFSWDHFKPNRSKTFFLSGGLNPLNVGKAIEKVQPNGLDVSSGVEDVHGNKNRERIAEFIKEANNGKTE